MKNKLDKNNKLLIKKRYLILFFLITYFIFFGNVFAANFNYADFDFDRFAEENKGYWSDQCADDTDHSEKCAEKIISQQKNYYVRLYKILAKYQKKGYMVDDNIIISTTFFGLTPDLFSDEGKNYNEIFGLDNAAYNYDTNIDLDNYDIDEIPTVDILENETDTLNILIKSLFSYSATCFAVYGDVSQIQNTNGDLIDTCSSGGTPMSVDGSTKCAVKDAVDTIGFWEYALVNNNVSSFFGMKTDKNKICEKKSASYPDAKMKYITSNGKEYTPDTYWNFLETSNYFDNKKHLASYFSSVLNNVNKSSMAALSNDEYLMYEEEIIKSRREIISNIKSILEDHGSRNSNVSLRNINNSLYWWPIGGNEITETSGKSFAIGNPSIINITSNFGPRVHPVTKDPNSFHYGVDISGGGDAGTVNIIAARDGIVERIISDCTISSENDCGGGYGNLVVLSHGDGNYTYYAHLHEGTINVTENQFVQQGEILAKMGSTGRSTGSHLHFEVRVGSDQASSAINPLDYISSDTPRQSSISSSALVDMLVCLEGNGPDDGGSNYKVYDDSGKGTGTLTVGPGVTLKYNKERFSKRGINADNYMFEGALIPKDIVDDIKSEILTNIYDNINSEINNEGIGLLPYQVDALVSRQYNTGNINNFSSNFKTYGNTQNLYDNYMNKPTTAVGFTGDVLKSRRDREWNLFHTGMYYTC